MTLPLPPPTLRAASLQRGRERPRARWLLVSVLSVAGLGLGAGAGAGDDLPAEARTSEVASLCREIGARLGSIGTEDCLRLNLEPTGSHTVKGRPIVARTLSTERSGDRMFRETTGMVDLDPPGRILLVGGCHGDELSSMSIVFGWLRRLIEAPDRRFHWRIAPLMNPDGLLGGVPQRTNANGVDLNRNMPSARWEDQAHSWWAERTGRNPRRYPGPLPLSEPESRWLFDEIVNFRPDVIVSLHAPYNNVDFDGPPEGPDRLGSLHLKLLGTFPGSLGRYGAENRIPIVTIELPSALTMPSEGEQDSIWSDLLDYLDAKSEEQKRRGGFQRLVER